MKINKTYLYVKIHKNTGLKYFGKTTRDPFKYKGSGLFWSRHLKVHGNNVATFVLGSFENTTEIKNVAEKFSIDNNIVESKKWANLKTENGLDGGTYSKDITPETKLKMSTNRKGIPAWTGKKHKLESKLKMSYSKKGKPSHKKGKPTGKPAHNKGIPMSQEQKIKISQTKKLNTVTVSCLQCKKTIAGYSNYLRWHNH